jgi:hypothetical protein
VAGLALLAPGGGDAVGSPTNPDVATGKLHAAAGAAASKANDFAGAALELRAACRSDPEPGYELSLAQAESAAGDVLAAATAYRQYISMIGPQPTDPTIKANVAAANRYLGGITTEASTASPPVGLLDRGASEVGRFADAVSAVVLVLADPPSSESAGLDLASVDPYPLPEDCGTPDPAALETAMHGAIGWIARNQKSDGSYVYQYDAGHQSLLNDYDTVRQAGVTWALYQAAGHFKDASLLAAADKGLGWMVKNTVSRHGWTTLVTPGGNAELGSSDLMIVGLCERRLATGDPQYDDLLHGLGRFLIAMQRDDGDFWDAYDLTADAPIPKATSVYFPGEAILALALLHEAFPGEGWDEHARHALDYLSGRSGYNQWSAYGIAELASLGELDDANIQYAHYLAARYELMVSAEARRQGSWYGHLELGEFSRGASAGTWAEALAALWRASQKDPRLADMAGPVKASAECMAGILAARQVTPEEAKSYPDPGKSSGAWFLDGVTRMDDQQHPSSGLMYSLGVANGDPTREVAGTLTPPQRASSSPPSP